SRIHSGEAAEGGEGKRGAVVGHELAAEPDPLRRGGGGGGGETRRSGRPRARRRAGSTPARRRKGGLGGKRGGAVPPTHYVPKSRSPKSPRPGRMYLRSLRARSRAAVKITASGTTAARWATPSGAATIESRRTSRAPRPTRPSTAIAAEPPVASMGSSRNTTAAPSPRGTFS